MNEKEVGRRDKLAVKRILGETLSAAEETELKALNAKLDADLPPKPGLPDTVKWANEEAERLIRENGQPKRRKTRP